MEAKDIVVAIFGAAVGLAGILLVFVGFVYTHGESQTLEDDRRKFTAVAKVGLIPFIICLVSAFSCVNWMFSPSPFWLCSARYTVYGCIGFTALYGIVAFLFYL